MRKTMLTLAFGLLSLNSFLQTLWAGDDPIDTNREIRKPTEMLLSDDYEIRKRGLAMIRNQRSNQITALKELILDKDNFVHRRQSVEASLTALGEMRAVEAVDLLVVLIDYPYCAHPDAKTLTEVAFELRPDVGRVSSSSFFAPPEKRYPAVGPLIRIGEPCLDELIERIGNGDGVTIQSPEIAVLKALEDRAPVRKRLNEAIRTSSEPRRGRLERARELLDPKQPTYQEILERQLQEIWDKDHK